VRRILHEEGLIPESKASAGPREHCRDASSGRRRIRCGSPISSRFCFARHERIYVAAFLDDHSRFIVSMVMAHHQRGPLVMEALDRGIAAYGTPEEILTDNGRSIRRGAGRRTSSASCVDRASGTSRVDRSTRKRWASGALLEDAVGRIPLADGLFGFRRLPSENVLFVDAYNFQRPHQGSRAWCRRTDSSGRRRRCATQWKRAWRTNAMRLAKEQPARQPFYLVGRLGDRDLSIAAEGGGLRVQMGNEKPQTIRLPKEEGHGRKKRIEKPTTQARKRALRARPTPKWLLEKADLDEIARRRASRC